ncbi:MAG: hypothetical protein ABIN94_04530 [Ferruginibacter sp.]
MSDKTKIELSEKELELVCNKEWILTKRNIIEKVYQLFGELATLMREQVIESAAVLPQLVIQGNARISKGENYLGLPYVMLDYPRHFTKDETLAIRTMFWWGNEFSIHLHLSGRCMQYALPRLITAFSTLKNNNYWVCINEDPWQHHFEAGNYELLENQTQGSFSLLLQGKPFIKIAKRISLVDWGDASQLLGLRFKELITLLEVNYPGDGRDLSPGIPKVGFDL